MEYLSGGRTLSIKHYTRETYPSCNKGETLNAVHRILDEKKYLSNKTGHTKQVISIFIVHHNAKCPTADHNPAELAPKSYRAIQHIRKFGGLFSNPQIFLLPPPHHARHSLLHLLARALAVELEV